MLLHTASASPAAPTAAASAAGTPPTGTTSATAGGTPASRQRAAASQTQAQQSTTGLAGEVMSS